MGRRHLVIRLVDGLGGEYSECLKPTHGGHVSLVCAMLGLVPVEAGRKFDASDYVCHVRHLIYVFC